MALTREEKEILRQRYETWGVDAVRQDLANPERSRFVDPAVDEFAHAWIAEQDMSRPMKAGDRLVKVMMIVAGVEFGIMVGKNLTSFLG